jgi:hypothetical protein
VEHDEVVFPGSALPTTITLSADQTAAAVTFAGPYILQGRTLRLMSGNVNVEGGAMAVMRTSLVAETDDHSIRKLGDGTLLVEGNAGQIAVKEGTLGGAGAVAHVTVRAGATVAPGGAGAPTGILSVNQSFTMHEGANLAIEIGGLSNSDPQNPQHDHIAVGGPTRLEGTLSAGFIDLGAGEFAPTNGDVFAVLTAAGGIAGAFDLLDLPPLSPHLAWQSVTRDATYFLAVTPRLPGDYNANGAVDAADYIVWRKTFGQSGVRPAADGTGPAGLPDGIVDRLDYELWQANFGYTLGGTANVNVPEPSSMRTLLVITSIAATYFWRKMEARF